MRRFLVLGAAVAVVATWATWALAPAAAAEVTRDTIGCSGRATFTGDDGVPVTVELGDTSATIPRTDTALWRGEINRVTHDHRGSVDLRLGPAAINIGEWGPTVNRQNQSTQEGVVDVPPLVRQLPSVKWKLTGFHRGTEGQCEAELILEVEGSTAATAAAGVAAAAGTVAAGAGMVQAARPRRWVR